MGDFHLLEPALDVGTFSEDFDPLVPPATGQEYIQRVVLEASKCENVVVAEIDRSRLKKQTVNVNASPGCQAAPVGLVPSLEWQLCQVADFSALRQTIARRKGCSPSASPVQLPDIHNETGWYTLCFGSNADPVEKEGTASDGTPPLVSVMLSMNQPLVEQVLEYHVEWLEGRSELSAHQGRWLYALLACLEQPLIPEVCSLLRTLARECASIRAAMVENTASPNVAPLNLLICLVARYFRQMDLVDT